MTPLQGPLKRCVRLVVVLVTVITCSASAQIQGVDFPVFFDDFHYPNTTQASGDLTHATYHNHVLGKNYWLEADGAYAPLQRSSSRKRAWYIRNDWDRRHAPTYWLSGQKHFLSTDRSKVFRSYPGIDSLDTESEAYGTNFMLLGANPGTYTKSDTILSIGSGLAANTGTWAARVLLYNFDGFKNHDTTTIHNRGMKAFPAPLWLQGSEHADVAYPIPHVWDKVSKEGHRTTWPEANFEIFSEFNPDRSAAISAGITWARYTSFEHSGVGSHINPRLGASGRQSSCYVVAKRSPRSASRYDNERDCLEFITGHTNKTGPIFATFVITMSESKVHHYILIWDEDLYHNRPPDNNEGYYPGFDTFIMQTIDDAQNYVAPRWMRVLFDNNIVLEENATSGILQTKKDMVVDWVLYTPRILTDTGNYNVWNLPVTVRRIRNHLWNNYNSIFASEPDRQIWRVNTTGRSLERPQPVMAWNTPSSFPMILQEYPGPDGIVYYTPEFSGAASSSLPHANINVNWRLYDYNGSLKGSASGHGFVFEAPAYEPWWKYGGRIEADVMLCDPNSRLDGCIRHRQLSRNWRGTAQPPHQCDHFRFCEEPPAAKVADIPSEYVLTQNAPNPFRASTTIRIGLPTDGQAQLRIFDVTGAQVEVLELGTLSAGYHEVSWDASQRAGGVYIYQLVSGEYVFAKKMILLP